MPIATPQRLGTVRIGRTALFRGIALSILCGAHALAAPPQLFRQPDYQSPRQGAPDDLLSLAGLGLAATDTVVYRALTNTARVPETPPALPTVSDAVSGIAPIVSSANAPYSVTVKLPQVMQKGQSYALWVHSATGAWSSPIAINDARPQWITPSYVYSDGSPGALAREIKIIGRNLTPSTEHDLKIRLSGPARLIESAVIDARATTGVTDFVARLRLPAHLPAGTYRIAVNRDGTSWTPLNQPFEVLPNPAPATLFKVSDPRFGGCRPDDGMDDTSCILRALEAAQRAPAGAVYFPSGTWDLIDGGPLGPSAAGGIIVPAGVQLRGAGSGSTRLDRHAEWNRGADAAAFTLRGPALVTGITFRDLTVYHPGEHAGPMLKLGGELPAAEAGDIIITGNTFDKPFVAIGSGGLPLTRLFITHNVFGAYHAALDLNGDKYNLRQKYRIDDSVIDFNVFEPGSELDWDRKSGAIASELGAGHRVDFSGNTADGTSAEYLYSRDDARGWRAGFFWNLNGNVEDVLVSQNTATCTGDKLGDGEAFSFDNNTNTFAFTAAADVEYATLTEVAVRAPLAARQNDRDVPLASYYLGHWVQIVAGPGLGQARRIVSYQTDPHSRQTTFKIAPAWDVVPIPGRTRIAIGREYWHLYVVDNQVDNRRPLCQKSNRSRRAAGAISLWAQSADSAIAANRQYDSDGIYVQQAYILPEHPCADCTMQGFFHSSLDIQGNLIDGEYDWASDCSASGIALGVAAAPWGDATPPTVGFGVSVSHNTIRHADAQYGGAIAQLNSWAAGPPPHRWALSEGLIIQHNAIADIEGPRAAATCGNARSRVGIAFPEADIAWHTVLYANSCVHVARPVSAGGVGTVKVCPETAVVSCECP